MNFYNEIDPYAAQWLRNLIAEGHIPPGVVDERSIEDVTPNELSGFTQCHFFAGLGGWPLALRMAGVSDSTRLWTGSCPCQPFSAAGKGVGFADERHLWPAFDWLIGKCRPDRVLGEQVEGPAGRAWLDLVATDLEGHGYAFGTAVFPAAGVGAPHARHRTYWMADSQSERGRGRHEVERLHRKEPGGPSEDILPDAWPDHAGSESSELVSEVCQASYGVPGRVGRLRAYGNAICVPQAVAFVEAVVAAQGVALPTDVRHTQQLAAE